MVQPSIRHGQVEQDIRLLAGECQGLFERLYGFLFLSIQEFTTELVLASKMTDGFGLG
ncbi:MAG: hypothetical protein AB4040_04845 [Synechococcus sp.]